MFTEFSGEQRAQLKECLDSISEQLKSAPLDIVIDCFKTIKDVVAVKMNQETIIRGDLISVTQKEIEIIEEFCKSSLK